MNANITQQFTKSYSATHQNQAQTKYILNTSPNQSKTRVEPELNQSKARVKPEWNQSKTRRPNPGTFESTGSGGIHTGGIGPGSSSLPPFVPLRPSPPALGPRGPSRSHQPRAASSPLSRSHSACEDPRFAHSSSTRLDSVAVNPPRRGELSAPASNNRDPWRRSRSTFAPPPIPFDAPSLWDSSGLLASDGPPLEATARALFTIRVLKELRGWGFDRGADVSPALARGRVEAARGLGGSSPLAFRAEVVGLWNERLVNLGSRWLYGIVERAIGEKIAGGFEAARGRGRFASKSWIFSDRCCALEISDLNFGFSKTFDIKLGSSKIFDTKIGPFKIYNFKIPNFKDRRNPRRNPRRRQKHPGEIFIQLGGDGDKPNGFANVKCFFQAVSGVVLARPQGAKPPSRPEDRPRRFQGHTYRQSQGLAGSQDTRCASKSRG
ncbi:hypothetical protein KM043_001270 [Ampulex compressa]|nr:hypothetical protein KM043_001270 [Ampulex compressa]